MTGKTADAEPVPLPAAPHDTEIETLPLLKASWARKVEQSHSRVPGLRKIPLRALGIILLIAVLNAAVWIAAAIVLVGLIYPVDAAIRL
jgi:high-affinity nickel-transport protein